MFCNKDIIYATGTLVIREEWVIGQLWKNRNES